MTTTAYRLAPLAPLIGGIASGLLPTPAATPYGTNRGGSMGRTGKIRPSLPQMARDGSLEMIPTPTAKDGNSTRNETANRSEGQKHHTGQTLTDFVTKWPTPTARLGSRRAAQAKRFLNTKRSYDLDDAVAARALWPTPTASEGNGIGAHGLGANDLRTMVARAEGLWELTEEGTLELWPTPTTQDASNNGGPAQMERNSLPLNATVGGPLSAAWVEWLMGLPPCWTELESGGQSSPISRAQPTASPTESSDCGPSGTP